MKLFLGSMLALAIAGSPLLARQEPQDDKDKPKQEEPKAKPKPDDKDKAKPKQEPQAKPDDKAKPKQEPQPKPDEKQQQKTDKERQKQDERQQPEANRPAQPRQNAPQAAPDREQAQGGHGRGQRIPEERYRAAFGKEHRFHVRHAERRFQYGGYWFEVVQPWPAAWVADDDCYLEEDGDEYFLVDLVHPDLRVEVIVVQS
jgi:outer membrane biosynthesis protein TonB